MKFWNPFRKNVTIERKSYSVDPDSFLAFAMGSNSNITASQAASFYQNTSSIATAVDMIAESIEQVVPALVDNEGNYTEQHEILDFLKNPNGFNNWFEFIGSLSRNYLLKQDTLIT